jgi:hypothetical protein
MNDSDDIMRAYRVLITQLQLVMTVTMTVKMTMNGEVTVRVRMWTRIKLGTNMTR